jgi:hypothetical protein
MANCQPHRYSVFANVCVYRKLKLGRSGGEVRPGMARELLVAIDRTSKLAFVEVHEKVVPHSGRFPLPPGYGRAVQDFTRC